MATKLYVDGLRFIVNKANRYATRWQTPLSANLTSDQYAALLDFISCCATLLAKLGPNIITP